MKLYYTPGVCSLSPHIVLCETGTPFEMIKVDLKTKLTEKGDDYRKINPNGYVPALVLDDGTVLTEGPAIVQYIADKAASPLVPVLGSIERYQLMSWLNFISTEVHKGFSPLFNAAMPAEGKAVSLERLKERFAYLDRHLATHDFVMGEGFSVADAYLFTVLGWAQPLKLDLSGYPNLGAYRGRVAERPAVRAALKAEGLLQ